MECFPTVNREHARKRRRDEQNWRRSRMKKQRYGPPGPPTKLTCKHDKKGKVYRCSDLTLGDQERFHDKFYDMSVKTSDLKQRQDCFILKYTESSVPKRSRICNDERGEKSMNVKYFIYKKSQKSKIQVCQKAFVDTLRITKNRVKGVVKRHFTSGLMPKETRGGDRKAKAYEGKKNSVIEFIKKFKVIENHYCRSKTASRQYLASNLNIKKMWRVYNEETADENFKVKESYFRHIFRTYFNIGFGSPRTDECSTCISFSEQLKNCSDPNVRNNLMVKQRCHKLKAKAFYSHLKVKRDNLMTVSFDCQKNQVLPRVPDQSAYYSRQLYKFNLTIVVGSSNAKQTTENCFVYDYDETEQKKGSNEISSAVYHFLNNLNIPNNVKVLRLVSDGCGGQNKNTTMMGMLSYWLCNNAPVSIKKIEFIFPVVGHSFLPPDRVFARIEKDIRKENVIIQPTEYTAIFSKFGTVRPLAGEVFDWKERCSEIFKSPRNWHFQFNVSKRFFFKMNSKGNNVLIRGEPHYRTDVGKYRSVTLRGENVSKMPHPSKIPPGVKVAPLKIRDVVRLLIKHFGEGWQELDNLQFYQNVLQSAQQEVQPQENEEEERDCCENYEDVPDLIV